MSAPCRIVLAARAVLIVLGGSLLSAARAQNPSPAVAVQPAELERRTDLIGKLVSVDDRVRFYQFHPGHGYDELYLKRTKVVFRLPPRLRPDGNPRPRPVLVQGTLVRDDGGLACEVTALTVLSDDPERLEEWIKGLAATDFEGRKSAADWAEKRGRDFQDSALLRRSASLRAEALQLEAGQKRATVDAPGQWLALAEDARRRKVQEPEPSAQAHRAFQAMLAAADRSDRLQEIVAGIRRFFPAVQQDRASGATPLGQWQREYGSDPAGAYRSAPAGLRKAFDRRLWADATQRLLEAQAAEDPASAIGLVSRAEAEIPERPEAASRLLTRGLEQAQQNLGAVRLAEVKSLAQAYREKLQQPDAALELYRKWLKARRDRLSPADAEGRVALAALYDELLQDRTAARELLERAWKLAPGSSEVAEAFRSRGYRLVKDQWLEEAPTAATPSDPASPDREAARSALPGGGQELRGMTADEVLRQIGSKPDRKAFSATRGQLIEQWIYRIPNQNQWRFVNFLHAPGEPQARVISYGTLPGTALRGRSGPAR